MNLLPRVINYLWPELALEGTSWAVEWENSDRDRFAKTARIFFVAAAIGYLAHFFFFDMANHLTPLWAWGIFRIFAALLCVSCFFFYSSSLPALTKYHRIPAIIVMGLGCHAQAQVVYFYPEAPWIYPFAFIFGGVLILQMSPIKSFIFSTAIAITCFPPLISSGIEFTAIFSAAFFFCLVSSLARTAHIFEIQAFLREHERDESRQEVIQLGKDFENRLKSFIPRVISGRIEESISEKGMSALEATIDVLKPRKQAVACLFSDIRGFTQGSKDLDIFLLDSAIPEVKACSDAVEQFNGIPRKIGDLIFAYFDAPELQINLLRAILAGITLSHLNKDINESSSSVEVRRYILISTGEAIVGNVGGLNSGVEITALGSPVNFLSRLDDATKSPGLSKYLTPGDILMCEESATLLTKLKTNVMLKDVDLAQNGVEIRDFPETKSVYILNPTETALEFIQSAVQQLTLVASVPEEVSF